jgi:methylenetetrahydrofolate reductase (NADPH)
MSSLGFSRRSDIGEKIRVSFEFFPPKTDEMETRLWDTVTRLEPLQPNFVSVTYGAGGSTRERTGRTIKRILNETEIPAAAHLTCVGASKDEVDAVIAEFAATGINRFVALRGDPASGVGEVYRPHLDGYQNGADLVAGLKAHGDFDISVAAYPEKHPESPDFATDIEMLKRKVDNGATRAITQFFFENDLYERYAGAHVPTWLAERFEGLEDDPQTHALVASAVAAEQVLDLVERGVGDFHFYTMNRSDLVVAICHMIGIRANPPVVKALAGSAAA